MIDEFEFSVDIGGGEEVPAILAMPEDPSPVGILLAPGAGAGQDHPWLGHVRRALAERGHPTMTFDYRYQALGRRFPDPLGVRLAVHEAAATNLAARVEGVVLAGKSMGSRIGAHLVADVGFPAVATVAYGFPLVPAGKTEPRDVTYLARIVEPQLFVSGSRDPLSPPELLADVVADLPDAELVVVDGADHSFNLPKRAGRSTAAVLDDLAAETVRFVADRVGQLGGGR
ncbi:MAG TPA: dienelactone hydrolase [Actinobacteria bacterium]|nr:dienelactone hydrolase [Actinomycetota bacterium]